MVRFPLYRETPYDFNSFGHPFGPFFGEDTRSTESPLSEAEWAQHRVGPCHRLLRRGPTPRPHCPGTPRTPVDSGAGPCYDLNEAGPASDSSAVLTGVGANVSALEQVWRLSNVAACAPPRLAHHHASCACSVGAPSAGAATVSAFSPHSATGMMAGDGVGVTGVESIVPS